MNEFFQRLKQRKMVQWAIAYVAWVATDGRAEPGAVASRRARGPLAISLLDAMNPFNFFSELNPQKIDYLFAGLKRIRAGNQSESK